jgi:hypothetical protein
MISTIFISICNNIHLPEDNSRLMMQVARQACDCSPKYSRGLLLEDPSDRNHVEGAMATLSKARRSEIHPGSSTARARALGRFAR